jgi:hypothetical protein
MPLKERIALYTELEGLRKRPLIVYVTSPRQGMLGLMASDAIPEFMDQLEQLPKDAKAADILVVSNGGDPIVAWRFITLLRERVEQIGVLVPQAAYSAATLLALGANEIVMHPNGHLGPVDPQITVKKGTEGDQRFGFEELASFFDFAKEKMGIKSEQHIHAIFELLSKEVGAVSVGYAARASLLSLSMGEKLLRLHMTESDDAARAKGIAEKLNKAFYHHGYPVGRTEAIEIGLPIAERDPRVEALIWAIWLDAEAELKARKPFVPIFQLMDTNARAILTAQVVQADYPPGGPPLQVVLQQPANKVFDGSHKVSSTPYDGIYALMESARLSSRFETKGDIVGARMPDLSVRTALIPGPSGWKRVDRETKVTVQP